jgi:hypothetical protein
MNEIGSFRGRLWYFINRNCFSRGKVVISDKEKFNCAEGKDVNHVKRNSILQRGSDTL